jgi:hypothetical protein
LGIGTGRIESVACDADAYLPLIGLGKIRERVLQDSLPQLLLLATMQEKILKREER